MSSRSSNDEIDTLISSYLDGSLNGAPLAEFNHRVANDPAFANRLYQIAHLHGSLREIGASGAVNLWGGAAAPADGFDIPLPLPALASSENRPRGNRSSAGAWLAACLFIAIGLALLYTVWPKNAATLAMITQARNVWIVRDGNQILVTENMELREGDKLRTSNNGTATVVFNNKPLKLEVDGGSHLAFPEPSADGKPDRVVEVEQGIVTAIVEGGKNAAPLLLSTPQAEVSLSSTRTTVAATNAETRLDVHEGSAELVRSSDAKTVKIASGQYAVAGNAVEMAALPFTTPAKEKEDKEEKDDKDPAVVANVKPPEPAKKDEPLKPWEMNITGFHVINADTGETVPDLSPLFYATKIEKKNFAKGFTIQAITSPDKVGSIVFQLNGQKIHTANEPPYTVSDAKGKGFEALDLAPGMYNLRATPYTKPDGKGKPGPNMVVRFQVVRQKGKAKENQNAKNAP